MILKDLNQIYYFNSVGSLFRDRSDWPRHSRVRRSPHHLQRLHQTTSVQVKIVMTHHKKYMLSHRNEKYANSLIFYFLNILKGN